MADKNLLLWQIIMVNLLVEHLILLVKTRCLAKVGCTADFKFLHFEACCYQAIDFAISSKLKRVEAGAQGHHKLQRGICPP